MLVGDLRDDSVFRQFGCDELPVQQTTTVKLSRAENMWLHRCGCKRPEDLWKLSFILQWGVQLGNLVGGCFALQNEITPDVGNDP